MEEKGLILEPGDDSELLLHCSCKSPLCAHCSLHQAMCSRADYSADKLGLGKGDVDDDNSDALPHPQSSMPIVDGAHSMQVGAARKLKLPCRRNSRSFPSSLAPHAHENLSKSWPPLPPTVDSVAYAGAHSDLQTPYASLHKKLDPPMLTLTSSSYDHEQEIMSTHPLFEQQFTHKKTINLTTSRPVVANPRRICRYCSREFPSGRALGGHMRVHGGLDVDRLPPTTNHAKQERRQFGASSTGRSSSLVANSRPEDQFTEVNCMVSGSHLVNSSGGGVIRRRINSEESMVKGIADDRKSALSQGSGDGEHIQISDAEEEHLGRKREVQLVRGLKEQSVIKKGVIAKEEISTPVTQATQKAFSNNEHADDDDEDNFCLQKSKLMALGNASELTPLENQGTLMSSASECVVDDRNLLHKVRSNLRPSRRRLWTDQEGRIVNNNKESSANPHNLGRQPSSLPTLPGQSERASSERARPCSECGKVFWSWKALFGHMRCHPEREWRGIQRPGASPSELEKLVRASKRLSSLSLVAGNAELETELESDAENREVHKPTEAACGVLESEKGERFGTNERVLQEIELVKGHVEIDEEGEGVENAEDCSMKGSTRRFLKATLLEESADDDLTLSAWPTRKRSRRSRANTGTALKVASTTSAEPALTSETATSSELRDHEKVSIKDQEDLDMANCLVLLSSAGNKEQDLEKLYMESTQESISKKRSSSLATTLDRSRHNNVISCNNEAGGDDDGAKDDDGEENEAENYAAWSKRPNVGGGSGMKYECSTCKRCFKSHQALGGHRASHRKTKGCFALMNHHAEESMQEGKEDNITEVDDFASSELNQWQAMGHVLSVAPPSRHQQDEEKTPFTVSPSTIEQSPSATKKKKFKGHTCSICHRIFPSGQALGGHKRCHWTGERIAESGSMASSSNNKAFLQEQAEWGDGSGEAIASAHQPKRVKEDGIDLNLPAPLDEEDEMGYDNAGLSSTEAMDPEVQNGGEDAGLDGEEINERHLVDFIGGKRRSLNLLSGECAGEGGRRHGNSMGAQPPIDWDLEVKCRSGKRAGSSGMWNQQWTNAASSAAPPNPI